MMNLCSLSFLHLGNLSRQQNMQAKQLFSCEFPNSYCGKDSKQPITSCHYYANRSLKSATYKVVDFSKITVFEVFCHFDSEGA